MKIRVQFYAGEKDGARPEIEVPALPRMGTVIFTWPLKDDAAIDKAKTAARKAKMIETQSVLAYRFIGDVIERETDEGLRILKEYRFERYAVADKTVPNPAV